MDLDLVLSCCLWVGWALWSTQAWWRVHRERQDAVHTYIPESFTFLWEGDMKYCGALIPPTLRGLRSCIDLAPFQLSLSLILHKEKRGTAHQLFWELEGSVLGWLQSSLWQSFDHWTEWELESSSPELPLLSLLLWYPGKAHHCASPVTCIWSLHILRHGFHICIGHFWLEICWFIGCRIEMAECVVLSTFWNSSSTCLCWDPRPIRGEALRLLIPARIFCTRQWQHLQVTKLSETGCLSWVLRRRERTLLKNSIKN